MRTLTLLLAVSCLAAPAHGQEGLPAAQALYASAQYDDALKAFDALKAAGSQAPSAVLAIEQGRAFCLLALDRKTDAQQAIETIIGLDPFFKPSEDDTPPKIRTAFRDVRRRVLGGALQQVYERAKAAYEAKRYEEAATGFGRTLALLDDPDLVLEAGPRADMRLVAKAFEDLSKAASAPPSPVPAIPPAPAGAAGGDRPPTGGGEAAPGAPQAAGASPQAPAAPLYDAASKDVTAPVAVRTEVVIPEALRRSGPVGDVILEVLGSATGTVESAVARQSPDPVYGAIVARAALQWHYRPATRAGAPVRYRLMTRVVITR
jgi:tetratricopeptide (TPR) repeat protein